MTVKTDNGKNTRTPTSFVAQLLPVNKKHNYIKFKLFSIGGGRSNLTPRFTRHFNLLVMPQPTQAILKHIFEKMLFGFFNTGFQPPVVS